MAVVNQLSIGGSLYDINDKRNLYDLLYPVGSVYISSTNTNPSTNFGGTWSLIDKEFEYFYLNDTSQVEMNTTNVTSINTIKQQRFNHNISFEFSINTKVATADTTLTWMTLTPANFGVSNFNGLTRHYGCISDDNQVVLDISIDSDGTLKVNDIVTRDGSGTSIAANKILTGHIDIPVRYNSMADSACNKFYWKRTA